MRFYLYFHRIKWIPALCDKKNKIYSTSSESATMLDMLDIQRNFSSSFPFCFSFSFDGRWISTVSSKLQLSNRGSRHPPSLGASSFFCCPCFQASFRMSSECDHIVSLLNLKRERNQRRLERSTTTSQEAYIVHGDLTVFLIFFFLLDQ